MNLKRSYLAIATKLRQIKHAATTKPAGRNESVFDEIHDNNLWKSSSSVSGPGSELAETEDVRKLLPVLFSQLKIRSFLDIPCGDFFWMKEVELGGVSYVGGDIVARLISANNKSFGNDKRQFAVLDVIKSDLPRADLVLCRDCLIHLSFTDAKKAIANIRRSGSRYLLSTTDPTVTANRPIHTGEYRPINLELPPFNMVEPMGLFRDRRETTGGESLIDAGKSLALYQLNR